MDNLPVALFLSLMHVFSVGNKHSAERGEVYLTVSVVPSDG